LRRSLYTSALLASIATGVFWLLYARLYRTPIPFAASGLLGGVWFLPIFIAIALQARADVLLLWIHPAGASSSALLARLVEVLFSRRRA
jgi:hypothetical protein